VGDDRDEVLGLQRARKSPYQLHRLEPGGSVELLELVAELDHHGDGERRLAHIDGLDALRNAVFEDPEIARGNPGDEVALVVHHRDVEGYDVDIGREGSLRSLGGLLRITLVLRGN